MEFRENGVRVLKKLCETYRECLSLLDSIAQYDDTIVKLSRGGKPKSISVCSAISQKERLVERIEEASVYMEDLHAELENAAAACPEICYHPMCQYLQDLQTLFYYRISTLLNKEDVNNPQVIDNLNACKESYELDKKISEVPAGRRQTFLFVPEKKN